MKYLGIDYGSKRVGLSVSDEEGILSFPYKIIKNNAELAEVIRNICGTENIYSIVLGESYNLSGEPNKLMQKINKFQNELKLKVKLPIYLEKEFMTTIHARDLFTQIGRKGKDVNNARKITKIKMAAADASAAALILQRFLDRKNKK